MADLSLQLRIRRWFSENYKGAIQHVELTTTCARVLYKIKKGEYALVLIEETAGGCIAIGHLNHQELISRGASA